MRTSLRSASQPVNLSLAEARASVAAAIHAGGSTGAHARDAFVTGIHTGLLYAAGAAVLAADRVAALLSSEAGARRPASLGAAPQPTSAADATAHVLAGLAASRSKGLSQIRGNDAASARHLSPVGVTPGIPAR